MAKPPWLSALLYKQPGVFGEFEKCLTFRSGIQVSRTPFQNYMERFLQNFQISAHRMAKKAQLVRAVSSFPRKRFYSLNRMFISISTIWKMCVVLTFERMIFEVRLISVETLGWMGRLYSVRHATAN